MSDTERMLSLALIHAASDPGVTREALEEIQGLAKDPQRLRALLESEGLGGEEGEGDEEEEPDPEDVPIGKRYRGSLRPADLTIGKRYRPTVTKRLPTVGSQPDRKFSSTQFDLADAGYSRSQGSPMDQLLELALSVADEDLAEDGREEDFHVTAKYGLHTDNAADVIDAVAGFGSVPVTLGGITLFEGEEADVIKIEVLGDRLHELNALLADSLPHTDTHPTYQPHLTLAYVKPGLGSKYVGPSGLEGQQLDFWHLVFSNRQRERTLIDLTRNAATVTPVAVDPDEDTGPALARWYAGWFEALEASGLEVSESDLASAEDELDGTGWCVGRDDDGEWEARATRSLGKKSWRFAHLTKAAQRAPSGYNRASPFHFNGKDYVGGQFIPGKAIEEASPQDRAKLQAAKEAESKKAEASKAARGATAVDPVALAHTLSQHAGAVELTKAERGNAARAYAALQRHHGDLTLHRIGELAARAEQAWRSVTDDDPNAEGLRSYWTRQLAAMAGWVERAKGAGLTGEAKGKPADAVAEDVQATQPEQAPASQGIGDRLAQIRAREEATPKATRTQPIDPGTVQVIRDELRANFPGVRARQLTTRFNPLEIRSAREPFTIEEGNAIRRILRRHGIVEMWDGSHMVDVDHRSGTIGGLVQDADGPRPEYASEEQTATKPAWALTSYEFASAHPDFATYERLGQSEGTSGRRAMEVLARINREHHDAVERAILAGRPVPSGTLKDHPDLLTKHGDSIQQVEPGFTGTVTGKDGRTYHFVDGKRVAGDQSTEIPVDNGADAGRIPPGDENTGGTTMSQELNAAQVGAQGETVTPSAPQGRKPSEIYREYHGINARVNANGPGNSPDGTARLQELRAEILATMPSMGDRSADQVRQLVFKAEGASMVQAEQDAVRYEAMVPTSPHMTLRVQQAEKDAARRRAIIDTAAGITDPAFWKQFVRGSNIDAMAAARELARRSGFKE